MHSIKSFFFNLTLVLGCLFATTTTAQGQRDFHFNARGQFKIVQFSDTHYIYNNPEAQVALKGVGEIMDAEKPDLVIITGDLIYGQPADQSLRTLLDVVAARKTPFIVAFGNHDDEFDLSREQLFQIVRSYPSNVTYNTEGISGVGNCFFPLKGKDGKTEAVFYCFDSHSYTQLPGAKGYDFIRFDQIAWYRKQSAAFTEANGGKPIPSLAFFHIPVPEFAYASADEKCILRGTRAEHACPSSLNSGLFASMKEMGDIEGIFVGHDHDNDYAVNYKGILLAYGRYSGGNTVYNDLKPNGARVILLTEGQPGFRTWIHLRGGDIIQDYRFPADFTKK
ncbi:MAG: metallophosphoesterase family protein [Tannerella sp.]|jgi:3',5'-cyclic AMP phosphodiesterase CpdA|nr:metallophosphoesterase family protein [Tannerella sp.]